MDDRDGFGGVFVFRCAGGSHHGPDAGSVFGLKSLDPTAYSTQANVIRRPEHIAGWDQTKPRQQGDQPPDEAPQRALADFDCLGGWWRRRPCLVYRVMAGVLVRGTGGEKDCNR